jgi:hypothetical protein
MQSWTTFCHVEIEYLISNKYLNGEIMPLRIGVNLTSGFWRWFFCLICVECTENLVLK